MIRLFLPFIPLMNVKYVDYAMLFHFFSYLFHNLMPVSTRFTNLRRKEFLTTCLGLTPSLPPGTKAVSGT
jgi:hypothetical protein